VNTPVELTVADGTGPQIQNVIINSDDRYRTDARGKVPITFTCVRTEKLKAERNPDSVRSNQPVVEIVMPISRLSVSNFFQLSLPYYDESLFTILFLLLRLLTFKFV
jgi:hypothetical protein